MIEFLLQTFATLFVVLDAPGVGIVFLGLTRNSPPDHARRMARRGAVIGGIVLMGFALAGEPLMRALGISMSAFRIAGGILLFLLAVEMMLGKRSPIRGPSPSEEAEAETREDISVFPLAIPLIAGPGAMTSVMLLTAQAGPSLALRIGVFAMLVLVLALTYLFMVGAQRMVKLLGMTGTNVVERVLAIILAALAVQFVVDGARQAFAIQA